MKNTISKIAKLISAEYIWDPEHKKNPGGGYEKTDKGWSKPENGKGQITEMQQGKKTSPVVPEKKFPPEDTKEIKTPAREKSVLEGLKDNAILRDKMLEMRMKKDFKTAIDKIRIPGRVTDETVVISFLEDPNKKAKLSKEEMIALKDYFVARDNSVKAEWAPEEPNKEFIQNTFQNLDKLIPMLQKATGTEPVKPVETPVEPNPEVQIEKPTYEKLIEKKDSQAMRSAISVLKKQNKGTILDESAIVEILKDPITIASLRPNEKQAMIEFFEMKKQLWTEDMKSADPQSGKHVNGLKGIQNMDTIISKLSEDKAVKSTPQPSEVTSRLFKDPGMISPADKPKVIQEYKDWLSKNKDKTDSDSQAKIKDIRLAIKMLEGPKFKKANPKLTGNMVLLVKDNDLGDELQELAGFKETIANHPQMSDKEYKQRIDQGMRLPRSQAQLKQAFVMNMNPMNYPDMQAFQAAKQRVQKMSVSDFGKLLASLNSDEEEIAV